MFQLELLPTTNDNARSADTMHNLDNICIIIPKRSMVHIILNHLILYLVYKSEFFKKWETSYTCNIKNIMYWIWLKNGYKNWYDHVSRDYGTTLNLIFLRSYFLTHFITNQDAFLYSKFWRVGMHDGAYRFFWWWGIISTDMSNQRNWAMMLVFKIFLCFDVPSNDTCCADHRLLNYLYQH